MLGYGYLGGEGEIRTHGTLVQRFSSLGWGVRGRSRMAVSRGNQPIPGPRIRRCSPLLLPFVATGKRDSPVTGRKLPPRAKSSATWSWTSARSQLRDRSVNFYVANSEAGSRRFYPG